MGTSGSNILFGTPTTDIVPIRFDPETRIGDGMSYNKKRSTEVPLYHSNNLDISN